MYKIRMRLKNLYIYSFLLNFLIGFLVIGYFLIKEKGLFTLGVDFNMQQIPFSILSNQAIKSGDIFWNWNLDLGSNFIAAMSFGMLGSPFFGITLPFPGEVFPYLIGWVLILKYAVAGLISYAYLQRFVQDKKYALLGSVLYAFSGYQSANMLFYNFHDVVACFPLLLIGMEKLVKEKKKGFLAISVFINALLSFYFFIGEVVFLILYYFFRFLWVQWREGHRNKQIWMGIIKCFWEGFLGVSMAAVLLIPSIISMLQNSRATSYIKAIDGLSYKTWEYLRILEGFFFPAEILNELSCIERNDYSNGAAYLPMVGMVLVFAYVGFHWKNRKNDWLCQLLLTLAVFALVPILNSSFYVFNQTGYKRWYYMPVLMMVLASMLILEKRKTVNIQKPAILVGCMMIGFILYITVIPWIGERRIYVNRPYVFSIICIIGLGGIVLTYLLISKISNENQFYRYMLLGIIGFSMCTTFLNIVLYRASYHMTSQQIYKNTIESVKELPRGIQEYRYEYVNDTDNYENKLMTIGEPCVRSFCSTISGSTIVFYGELGMYRDVVSKKGPIGTSELLSVKYYISDEMWEEQVPIQVLQKNNPVQYVYEDKAALPIGFTYDLYMEHEEYAAIDNEDKAMAMLKALIINNPDDLSGVSEVLEHYDAEKHGKISPENMKQDIYLHLEECSQNFKRNNYSFTAEIIADRDKYAFFSVYYDKGWTAYVNGEETEIMPVNGLMAIPVGEGRNEICFIYRVPGLIAGISISMIGFVVCIIYLLIEYKVRKKE